MPSPTNGHRPDAFLPLSEVAWEVLLALAGDDLHGYAILLEVERRTEGRLQLLPGSLYRAIHRLREEGLLLEVADAEATAADPRRRVYRLSALGLRVLAAEARRLAAKVRAAGAVGLLAGEEAP